jgi:hypothetical protein
VAEMQKARRRRGKPPTVGLVRYWLAGVHILGGDAFHRIPGVTSDREWDAVERVLTLCWGIALGGATEFRSIAARLAGEERFWQSAVPNPRSLGPPGPSTPH